MRFSYDKYNSLENTGKTAGLRFRYSHYEACVDDPAAQAHFVKLYLWTRSKCRCWTIYFN